MSMRSSALGKRMTWHREEAEVGGVRVRILLRTGAAPAKVYDAARRAAHDAAESLHLEEKYDASEFMAAGPAA